MEFKLIDKNLYDEIAPKSHELAMFHAKNRTDLFFEPELMSKNDFKKRIKIKGFIGVAAYENNKFIGYCFCRVKNFSSKNNPKSKSLWIDELFVSPEYRRSGYGTKLFEEIQNIARKNNCFIIEFDVWQMNESAQKFYDSLGCKTQRITREFIL